MGNPLRKNRPRSGGQIMTTIEDIKKYTVHIPLDGRNGDSLGGDLDIELDEQQDDYTTPEEEQLIQQWCGDNPAPVIKIRGRRHKQLTLTKEALKHLIEIIRYRTQDFNIDPRDPDCRNYMAFGQRLIDSLTHTLNGTTRPPKPKKPKSLTAKQREELTKQRHRLLTKEAQIIWKKMEQWHRGKPLPKIKISYTRQKNKRGMGFAHESGKPWGWIQIDLPTEIPDDNQWWHWAVLVHELAHHACPPIKAETGKGWRDNSHHRVFYYCIRHVWEKRLKCELTFKDVKTWGYSVDRIIEKQGKHLVRFKLPKHKK